MKSRQGANKFDAVIIGSGMGSLTTAAILADQGLAVTVLEKHSQLGGYTQSFQRDSWYWDVAVHYICSMEPGDLFFHGCRYLTENKLRWKKMPHIFDHFCFPGFQVDVPSSPEEYRSHLKSLFPDENLQIDRYFDDLKKFQKRLVFLWATKMLPDSIAKPHPGEHSADCQVRARFTNIGWSRVASCMGHGIQLVAQHPLRDR